MPDHGYMPDQIRAQLGRTTNTGALAIACPQPGCLAEAGQPCTSGRGRRRDPHEARLDAAQAAPEGTAAVPETGSDRRTHAQ